MVVLPEKWIRYQSGALEDASGDLLGDSKGRIYVIAEACGMVVGWRWHRRTVCICY